MTPVRSPASPWPCGSKNSQDAHSSMTPTRQFGCNTGCQCGNLAKTFGCQSGRFYDRKKVRNILPLVSMNSSGVVAYVGQVNTDSGGRFFNLTAQSAYVQTSDPYAVQPSRTVGFLPGCTPVIADTGEILVPTGTSYADPLGLYFPTLTTHQIVADSSGFSRIGHPPGISSDGSLVAFYGQEQVPAGQPTKPPSIYVAVAGAWVPYPLTASGDGFTSFRPDSPVTVSSDSCGVNRGFVVYLASKSGGSGAYLSRLLNTPSQAGSPFTVARAEAVALVGDSIPGLGVLGNIDGTCSVNTRGDLGFWTSKKFVTPWPFSKNGAYNYLSPHQHLRSGHLPMSIGVAQRPLFGAGLIRTCYLTAPAEMLRLVPAASACRKTLLVARKLSICWQTKSWPSGVQ